MDLQARRRCYSLVKEVSRQWVASCISDMSLPTGGCLLEKPKRHSAFPSFPLLLLMRVEHSVKVKS